jgi:hypothetical protein
MVLIRREGVRMRGFWLGLIAASVLCGPNARAADLAAHTAVYKLSLDTTKGDVVAASGTMVYEMIDACDGWAVHQHLALSLTNHDGQDVKMVSDYNTYEAKDGLSLRFRMHQATEGEAATDIAGEAKLARAGGDGSVTYSEPDMSTKTLATGTLFPTTHTATILDAAQKGKKFLSLPMFDGTSADGGQTSSVVMTGWDKGPTPTQLAPLAALPSGRVRIAFFDKGGDDGADSQQPDYEVAMRYWANGVADQMAMDFSDFVVLAKIEKLTVPKPGC